MHSTFILILLFSSIFQCGSAERQKRNFNFTLECLILDYKQRELSAVKQAWNKMLHECAQLALHHTRYKAKVGAQTAGAQRLKAAGLGQVIGNA